MKTISTNKLKKSTQVQRYNLYNRFNKSKKFLELYQRIMIPRIFLNYDKKYSKKEANKIVTNIGKTKFSDFNTNIKGGLLLSCNVEAEFYLKLQELLNDITGEYQLMDEFIVYLLHWFYWFYANPNNKKAPYIPLTKRKINLKKRFNKRFKKYYKNII